MTGIWHSVRSLAPGPLDIVGDVHGELDALMELLFVLGYDEQAAHPDRRRLVFVGDLCDRGPDSPEVLRRVREWQRLGRADCALGNHELSLLRDDWKPTNGWFRPAALDHDQARGHYLDVQRFSEAEKPAILDWLASLPLVLERDDLRIVHACWQREGVETLKRLGPEIATGPQAVCEHFDQVIRARLAADGTREAADAEQQRHAEVLADPSATPPPLPHSTRLFAALQTGNPVRALTSGLEEVVTRPFYSGGKWRTLDRRRWWNQYLDPVPVLFGHYWRSPSTDFSFSGPERDLFYQLPAEAWLGPGQRAFCLDYCVGHRAAERLAGAPQKRPFQTRLGAMRWPERALVLV